MMKYKKVYADFFHISRDEPSPCERCLLRKLMKLQRNVERAVEIHHTEQRGMGGDQTGEKDDISKLVGSCRACHTIMDSVPEENEEMKEWAADLEARKIVIRKYMFQEI